MKKISLKKLQVSFVVAFGGLIISLILLGFNLQQAGIIFFIVALLGVVMMLQAGQCPHCHDARSAKWVNPLGTDKELFCTRCGKKMEMEDDGWIKMKKKKEA